MGSTSVIRAGIISRPGVGRVPPQGVRAIQTFMARVLGPKKDPSWCQPAWLKSGGERRRVDFWTEKRGRHPKYSEMAATAPLSCC